MTTQEFIKSRKVKNTFIGTFETHTMWRITTETLADLPENMKSARWFPIFGSKITAVRKVTVKGYEFYSQTPNAKTFDEFGVSETYIEVETDHAVACIVDFTTGPEVGGVVLKCGLGKNNPCMTLGTWKKRGHKVGHAMYWSLMKHYLKQSKSPNSADSEVCPAQAYKALAGTSTLH